MRLSICRYVATACGCVIPKIAIGLGWAAWIGRLKLIKVVWVSPIPKFSGDSTAAAYTPRGSFSNNGPFDLPLGEL